ncbi:MAG: hypothetical protein MMC33_003826 [Icmadophila ericetorum]|nr:hypothetical protein [Icmadophila ericetorum]
MGWTKEKDVQLLLAIVDSKSGAVNWDTVKSKMEMSAGACVTRLSRIKKELSDSMNSTGVTTISANTTPRKRNRKAVEEDNGRDDGESTPSPRNRGGWEDVKESIETDRKRKRRPNTAYKQEASQQDLTLKEEDLDHDFQELDG